MEHAGRESESGANRGSANSTEQKSNPWSNLSTITTFDRGDNTKLTIGLRDTNKSPSDQKIAPSKNPENQELHIIRTVFVGSLLQLLCDILGKDKSHGNKAFSDILKIFKEMRLIDDTYDAVEFEGLKKKYQQTLKQMFTIAYSECESDIVPFVSKPLTQKLRYEEEFREISFIAKGGFGKVYKAQHRLDGIEYAIKKINVPTDQVNVIHEQLNEVRTMAKLDHINIVSYKAAWIEPPSYNSSVPSTYRESRRLQTSKDQEKPCNMLFDELFDHKNGIKTKNQCKVYRNTDAIRDAISERFEELHSSDDIAEERITEESNNGESTDFSSDIVSFRVSKSNENLDQTNINEYTKTSSSNTVTFSSKSKENFDQTNTDTDTSNSSHKKSNLKVSIYTPKENQPSMTLYIQMALCEETLQQWLLSKTSATPGPLAKEIFRQILSGVDYMHSQQIVHHDIKPSNIFISNSGRLQIQLSDFGLACPLQIGNKHAGVGTRMYAAPEQLMGKCDIKSDIYSIGVVLTELLTSTKTRMELSNAIRDIKNGIIPDDLKHYKWVHVVTQLVQEDPTKRPMAQKVLQDLKKEDLLNGLKKILTNFTNRIHSKDDTIQELQEDDRLLQEIEGIIYNTINKTSMLQRD